MLTIPHCETMKDNSLISLDTLMLPVRYMIDKTVGRVLEAVHTYRQGEDERVGGGGEPLTSCEYRNTPSRTDTIFSETGY